MPSWIAAVLQWLGKFTPRYAFVIGLVAAALLFTPGRALKYFDLDAFANTHRSTSALIFAASVFLLLSYPISIVGNWIVGEVNGYRYKRMIKRHMENLGSDQIALLMQFAESGRSTIIVPFHKSAIAQDLVEKGILYRPAQIGDMSGIGFSVTPEAAPFVRYKTFQKIVLQGVKKQL
jgi:hypothetical protein